jgi:nucleotide-binding universal stress UspA family protein
MDATFTTIVVPVELDGHSDRALEVARSLSTLGGVPVQLVTVLPRRYDPLSAIEPLNQRARAFGLTNWTPIVMLGDDPALVITEHVLTLAQPLVVMATAVHSIFAELVSASTSATLLSHLDAPVLVIGPNVQDWTATAPTLLACVSPSDDAGPMVSVMARWVRTFGGGAPWFLEVLSPGDLPVGDSDLRESGLVHRRADQLTALGIASEWEVLHGGDPVAALESFAEGMVEGVLIVESQRWTDPSRHHLHSVARKLAHRSRQPVLVLPHVDVPVSARARSSAG